MASTYGRHALAMVWDFAELGPFGEASGGADGALAWIVSFIQVTAGVPHPANVFRGSATKLAFNDSFFDAVITDPPYYDNVPYADISDFFYVWLRRSIGSLHPDHFATELTPKKTEVPALASRYGGNMGKATTEYESMMQQALREAARILKPGGELTVVYAHKRPWGGQLSLKPCGELNSWLWKHGLSTLR
jgi:putative DNA methylase